jgi:hypothetical protein
MIPLLIMGIKALAEDIAEDQAEKVAGSVLDSVLQRVDGITLDEAELRLCASPDEVVAATLAKVKTALKSNG